MNAPVSVVGILRRHPGLCLGGLAMAACAACIFFWPDKPQPAPTAATETETPTSLSAAVPDLREPAEDFDTYLHVLLTGGCEITRPVAIAWLDRISRENSALPEDQASLVMGMIADGGHSSWSSGYRQHLFNSAFNALHRSRIGEPYTLRLLHLSLHDSDRTMRLYALQHLGAQRRAGQLADGPLSEKVRTSLLELAKSREEEVSGYAIDLLTSWDGGGDGEPEPSIRDLALATAADTSRPVDIRVTALHAAGSASLPLARALAARSDEHVMLRKAAIARIGEHGTAGDLASLETLRAESSRLAQAATPALAKLQKRQHSTAEPDLAPY
jgi:hypothetical protein